MYYSLNLIEKKLVYFLYLWIEWGVVLEIEICLNYFYVDWIFFVYIVYSYL